MKCKQCNRDGIQTGNRTKEYCSDKCRIAFRRAILAGQTEQSKPNKVQSEQIESEQIKVNPNNQAQSEQITILYSPPMDLLPNTAGQSKRFEIVPITPDLVPTYAVTTEVYDNINKSVQSAVNQANIDIFNALAQNPASRAWDDIQSESAIIIDKCKNPAAYTPDSEAQSIRGVLDAIDPNKVAIGLGFSADMIRTTPANYGQPDCT